MTEEVLGAALPDAPVAAPTAGSLLREAREGQGVHIATLAATMKVSPRKLEALESNRLQDLPDVTFARALAQTMCRSLRIDAKVVLDLMPAAGSQAMETVAKVQATPYKDHNSKTETSKFRSLGPMVWAALALLVAAGVVFLAPPSWFEFSNPVTPRATSPQSGLAPTNDLGATEGLRLSAPSTSAAATADPLLGQQRSAVAPGEPTSNGAANGPSVVVSKLSSETVFSAPVTSASNTTASKRPLVITTIDSSWIEVLDATGRVLINETVTPGRTVGLEGTAPLKVMVGNASATSITFMGRVIDVASNARENVARFELK